MARLKPLQKSFLKSLLSKVSFFPAIWFFIWAVYPIATDPLFLQFGFNLTFYIMLSLFNWICFLVSLLGAVILEMLMSKPELRGSLRHIERGKPKEQKKGEKRKWYRKKEKKLPLY